MKPLLSCEIWKHVFHKSTVCFVLLYISHIWFQRFKEVQLSVAQNSRSVTVYDMLVLLMLVGCVYAFVHIWESVCMRVRKSMCACASTHLIMIMWWVPWLRIRWDQGWEQLFCTCCLKHSILLSFPLPSPVVLHRQYTERKKERNIFYFCQQTNWILLEAYYLLLLWCCEYMLPLVVVWVLYM